SPPVTSCSPTWARRSTSSWPARRRRGRVTPTPCTGCGWPSGGCAPPCAPSVHCSTGSAASRCGRSCAGSAASSGRCGTSRWSGTRGRRCPDRPVGSPSVSTGCSPSAGGPRTRRSRARWRVRGGTGCAPGSSSCGPAPPLSARADGPASEELTRLVRRADRRVRRRYRAAQVAISPAERDRLHHEVRKAAKRARYAAEAVAPAVGEPARRYAAGMERVQEALGDERDAVTLGELLAGLVETTSTEREAADLAAVAERCRARAADARAAFVEVWREVARESGWPLRPR